jgi:DNA-binding MarR family transcriptional regulator/GNAT superfamily N-acetyltransferase
VPVAADRVTAVRSFNRFYTRRIGALGEHLLDSPFSLAEMRVLYELAHRRAPTASDLCADLGLDPGYLSRILRRFRRRGYLQSEASEADARRRHLRLTPRGRRAFAPYEARARREVRAMLTRLPASRQTHVVSAMRAIEHALRPGAAGEVRLRPHRPGDMGWVVHRHGAIYAQEWNYNHEFEALVARIVADFLDHFDPARERCWIAEQDGEIVGTVFVVRKSKTVAKLRLLLVEPRARGLGVGRQLIDACVRFAREAGYRTMTLWTQSHLLAARSLYERAGFRCVDRVKHRSFGKNLVAETWDLAL